MHLARIYSALRYDVVSIVIYVYWGIYETDITNGESDLEDQ